MIAQWVPTALSGTLPPCMPTVKRIALDYHNKHQLFGGPWRHYHLLEIRSIDSPKFKQVLPCTLLVTFTKKSQVYPGSDGGVLCPGGASDLGSRGLR